jgi:hypothetical protein
MDPFEKGLGTDRGGFVHGGPREGLPEFVATGHAPHAVRASGEEEIGQLLCRAPATRTPGQLEII